MNYRSALVSILWASSSEHLWHRLTLSEIFRARIILESWGLRQLFQFAYRSFATTVSQLKFSDISGETFKGFEVLYFSMSATTTQLLSSGEFYKLRNVTIPVKSASANVSFYTNKSKMPNFELWRHSCRKWAICTLLLFDFRNILWPVCMLDASTIAQRHGAKQHDNGSRKQISIRRGVKMPFDGVWYFQHNFCNFPPYTQVPFQMHTAESARWSSQVTPGSSVWILLHTCLLAPITWRRLLHSWKICGPPSVGLW